MKNHGFTLIELLVCMLIILTLNTVSFRSYKFLSIMKRKTLLNNTRVECKDFISISKGYCRENNLSGYILYDKSINTFKFIINLNCISKYIIPVDIRVSKISFENNRIEIDNTGYIKNAGTIFLYNEIGESLELSVAVYTNYVKEK